MPTPLAIAVDFGGTKVEAALVDSDGRLVEGSRHRRPTGRTATIPELEASVGGVVRDAIASLPDGAELVGLGIGCAGPIDRIRGLVSPSTFRTGATTRCATTSRASSRMPASASL
ncbi:ROK family protein [Leifsonia poae]|uniref:ROK family protein n=1 Tax=Leifsonia poae TaxID=110933 RepID=UPI003D6738A2